MSIQIEHARFPSDTETVRTLFTEYASSLGIDLTFQQFQTELSTIPGKYARSEGGALLLARGTEHHFPKVLGCVALRRSDTTWAEMKRLYVAHEARGQKLGERLVLAVLSRARELGYQGVRLDTLADMTAAQGLYRRLGFEEIDPYYETPVEGTVFLGLRLVG